MNMMTPELSPRARWLKSFPVPPTIPVLLAQVDRACFVARITSTRFGAQLGDASMIHRIRKGTACRAEKRVRILAHADALVEQSREAALALLMDDFDEDDIGGRVDFLIGLIDKHHGDEDLEDSETGQRLDADGRYLSGDGLPGTVDDAEPDEDAQGDIAWPEWHLLGRHKVVAFGAGHHDEDAEDDDPREDDDQDDLIGDERDAAWPELWDGRQPTNMLGGAQIAFVGNLGAWEDDEEGGFAERDWQDTSLNQSTAAEMSRAGGTFQDSSLASERRARRKLSLAYPRQHQLFSPFTKAA